MRSEYQVLSSESGCRSVSGGRRGVSPPFEGCKDNPLLRGDRLRSVQRSNQGSVDGAMSYCSSHSRNNTPTVHTPRSANQASPFCLHISPLKRGFTSRQPLLGLALLFVIISLFTLPAFGQTTDYQSETNSVDTPQTESGTTDSVISPQGETMYPQLEEYIRIAIEDNPELRSLYHLYEAEKERAREVGVLPDPELNIMYDFNPMMAESQLGRFSVSAMQMFPWFGSLGTMRDAQRAAAEADRAQIDVRQLDILRDLQIAWFDIAEVEEQIRITEQNIELVRELEILVEIRYETGRAMLADILRIQMEEQRLRNRIENLEDELNPLKANFNEFLNRESTSSVETADTIQTRSVPYSDEQIHELVQSQNPAFEALMARETALDHQRRSAQLAGRPSFGLGLEVMGRDFGPMSMNPGATESFIGMATVRLPIFRSRTRAQQQQVTERLNALDFDRHQTENRLATSVESVLEEIRKSERNIRMLEEELVPRARQALDILSEEYSVGNARFDELLQIQRELLDLEFEHIEAVVEQNKAIVRIESLIGGSPLSRGDR